MDAVFKIWETNRKIYLSFLEKYTTEQLNYIPEGLSNNLIWNIGHVLVSQQGLVYRLSGLPMLIPEELFEKYKNGSQPNSHTSVEEINEIKKWLTEVIEKTKLDYTSGVFKEYKEFTTGTGFLLASTHDAIIFNNYHEGMHLGFMLKIKKFL